MTVRHAAESLGLTFEGDGERSILGVAALSSAGAFHASFVNTRKAVKEAATSAAGCLIVPLDFDNASGRTILRAKDPRREMARLIRLIHPQRSPVAGIHPSAVVDATAEIGTAVSIGPHAVIGARAAIGERTVIAAGACIGDHVHIGPDSVIHPNVTIYEGVEIGARAVIHSGAVLGADGFGFVFDRGRYEKFPQVGKVVIGDDVEIGANSTIDRAALGVTAVGNGVKLDNMVHIAHNCSVGNHVVIAAQTGIAGGCTIEDYAVIGGQVGMGDSVTIKSGAIVGSGAGILSSKVVKGGGEVHWGTPARPLKEYLETLANLARLPELRRRVAELEKLVRRIDPKI
jgi:UDP-3-O-[3-hydroxymyristoyl] glucosamine N-acyltransferase